MIKFIKYICLAALSFLLPMACGKAELDGNSPQDPEPAAEPARNCIAFSITSSDTPSGTHATRQGMVNSVEQFEQRPIAVTAALADGTVYFSQAALAYTNDGWKTPFTYYWPSSVDGKTADKLDFYARSPQTDASVRGESHNSFVYSLPTENSGQHDLMYAVAKDQQKSAEATTNVPLDFHHALAAISFRAKKNSTRITAEVAGVEIVNIKNSATFHYPSVTTYINELEYMDAEGNISADNQALLQQLALQAKCGWTLPDGYGSGRQAAAIEATELTADAQDITAEGGAILVIPQTLVPWQRLSDPDDKESIQPVNDASSYLAIQCRVTYNGLYLSGSAAPGDYGTVYVPFGGTFDQECLYIYTLDFGYGYNLDGSEMLQIHVQLTSTIRDWSRETITFDKHIL